MKKRRDHVRIPIHTHQQTNKHQSPCQTRLSKAKSRREKEKYKRMNRFHRREELGNSSRISSSSSSSSVVLLCSLVFRPFRWTASIQIKYRKMLKNVKKRKRKEMSIELFDRGARVCASLTDSRISCFCQFIERDSLEKCAGLACR